jgi:hypothetical protein
MTDETNNGGGKKPNKKSSIPKADSDFGKVAASASTNWTANPWLTLKWTTAAEFATATAAYNAILAARQTSGATRPQITKALTVLNKEIDRSLSYVKGYLAEKYDKDNSLSYYPAFGISYYDKQYAMPVDQSNRQDALKLMLEAIESNDFQDKTYGLAYWTGVYTKYVDLVEKGRELDGGISTKVGSKNELKISIKKGLNALINVLKGNYPDTYKQELRQWGFQKDKY